YVEAEEHIRAGYDVLAAVFGPGSPGSRAMSRLMVESLEAQGRTDGLPVWRERAGLAVQPGSPSGTSATR
ncbi:MAG TPA: hypothetical protein VKU85_08730, partial [bacterium]|nr:hypothetical protein [bacterium]